MWRGERQLARGKAMAGQKLEKFPRFGGGYIRENKITDEFHELEGCHGEYP